MKRAMRTRAAPIAARDWLASLALHAAAALAVAPVWLSQQAPASDAALRLPILWVEPAAQAIASSQNPEHVVEALEHHAAASRPAPLTRSSPPRKRRTRPAPNERASASMTESASSAGPTSEITTTSAAEPAPASTPDPAPSIAAPPSTPDSHAMHATHSMHATRVDDAPTTDRPPNGAHPWRADFEELLRAHKRYPPQARRMRQQGIVTVHARFAADGELVRCEVVDSSGFRALDEAALQLVRLAAHRMRANAAPGRLAELRIPISYELNAGGT